MEDLLDNSKPGGKMHPWYVTGLVEGEGCFSVSFNKRARLKVGIETRPSFSVSLASRDLELIKALRDFFGCGGIRFCRQDRTYKYEVRSIDDLWKRIIPHFRKFPLRGSKAEDFEKFVEICDLVRRSHHLNPEYLRHIIELAYSMNVSVKRRYGKEELLRLLREVKR